jgi:hypothetical protein
MPAQDSETTKLHVRTVADPRHVFLVDPARACHVPAVESADGTFLLCPYFDVQCDLVAQHADTWGRCPNGGSCGLVHADLRGATKYAPHLLSVCRTAPATYAWLAPGTALQLSPLGSSSSVEVDSGRVLQTRAGPGGSICSHFALKGRCDRGSRCKFAHVTPKAEYEEGSLTPDSCVLPGSPGELSSQDPSSRPTPVHGSSPRRLSASGVPALKLPLSASSAAALAASARMPVPCPPRVSTGRGWRHNPYPPLSL